MLIEFDQNTIANMTAALDYWVKKIPADRDSTELASELQTNSFSVRRCGKLLVHQQHFQPRLAARFQKSVRG